MLQMRYCMRFIKLTLIVLVTRTLYGSSDEYLHINLHPLPTGMFSVFSYAAGILYEYDTHEYAGIKVDFENNGLYYDQKHGSNWWEYYCKPICLGNTKDCYIKQF